MSLGVKEILKKHKADIILIASILAVAISVTAALLLLRQEGAAVAVEINGTEVARYSLSVNGEYSLNGGTNILVVENGEAYMKYASCPDGVCVNTGHVRYSGETIVCLPNKVSVTVMGGDSDGVDLVS